mgnify:CR=1 FL=1
MKQPTEIPAAWDGMHTFQVLDFLSNPMMVADHDMVIRYVNEAAYTMFERIEDSIRQDLPHFTARDVVFSLNRAKGENAQVKSLLSSMEEAKAVDDLTVQVKTKGPNLIFPDNLTNLFIMSEKWSKANGAETTQDTASKTENGATRAANGTGAYVLGSVLEQFFAKYVSLNSFTETRIMSTARGVIMQWPARVGRCEIL